MTITQSTAREKIIHSAQEAIRASQLLLSPDVIQFIHDSALMLVDAFNQGGKVLIAGNGGSLCDAMHFAEELTGVFRNRRRPLPAIALADPGHMSCVANDLGYETVFARGIEAFGAPGDVAIFLTTSGNSANIVSALETARRKKLKNIAFLGQTGGKMKGLADLEWIVSGFPYSDRIQEVQMAGLHIMTEVIEGELFAEG